MLFAQNYFDDVSFSLVSPVIVEVCGGDRIPKRRSQLLPPEDVLWHQPVHVVFLQQHHGPGMIGPGSPSHEGELPEVHYSHGRVYRKPWKMRKTSKAEEESRVNMDGGVQRLTSSHGAMF